MASKTMTRSVRMINRKKLKLSILSFKVHIIILNIIIKNVLLLTDSEKLLDLNVVLEAKRQGNQWKWGQILFVVSVCHSPFRMVRLRSWKEIKKRFFKRKRILKKKTKNFIISCYQFYCKRMSGMLVLIKNGELLNLIKTKHKVCNFGYILSER